MSISSNRSGLQDLTGLFPMGEFPYPPTRENEGLPRFTVASKHPIIEDGAKESHRAE